MTATDPDLQSLEQERDFLLRSLADLDVEYEAGDIDDDDYRQLTDDYTARTAAVLRAIAVAAAAAAATSPRRRAGRSRRSGPGSGPGSGSGSATGSPESQVAQARPAPTRGAPGPTESAVLAGVLRSRRRWRMASIAALIVVFGGVTAWVMTSSSGDRSPGQTATGNAQIPTNGGVDPRLAQASDLVNQGKVSDALKLYDTILKDDPNQPAALANGGWLLAQAGLSANRTDWVDEGLAKIVQSERIDPSNTTPHFFRGFLLLRAKNDPAGAVTELRFYLGAVDPRSAEVPQVEALLQEAIKAAGPALPAGPNAPTTTVPAP